MSKRRAIISYDKLTIDQKKQVLRDFPDGYINHLTTIKTPTGDVLDALIWETDDVIYLVKINKTQPIVKNPRDDDDDDDNDFDDDMDKASVVGEDMDDDSGNDDDDDGYDKPDDSDDDESDDDENY